MTTYITLVNGITAPELTPGDPATSPAVVAAALFTDQAEGPLGAVDLESVDVAIGEYDLVVRYVADGPDVPVVVAVALSRLLGGKPTTLTVIDAETQTGSPPPSARGIRLATDLQASGHDGAVRRAQAVLGSGPGAASSEA